MTVLELKKVIISHIPNFCKKHNCDAKNLFLK